MPLKAAQLPLDAIGSSSTIVTRGLALGASSTVPSMRALFSGCMGKAVAQGTQSIEAAVHYALLTAGAGNRGASSFQTMLE